MWYLDGVLCYFRIQYGYAHNGSPDLDQVTIVCDYSLPTSVSSSFQINFLDVSPVIVSICLPELQWIRSPSEPSITVNMTTLDPHWVDNSGYPHPKLLLDSPTCKGNIPHTHMFNESSILRMIHSIQARQTQRSSQWLLSGLHPK